MAEVRFALSGRCANWQLPNAGSAKGTCSLADGTRFYAPLGRILRDGDERACHLYGRWLKAVGGEVLICEGT